jgi:hypothetical protein
MRENRTYGSGGQESGDRLLTLIGFALSQCFRAYLWVRSKDR